MGLFFLFFYLFIFFRTSCKNSHSVFSGNNVEVLRNQDLQDLTEKQLFQLLLQNDPWLLPEVSCPGSVPKTLRLKCDLVVFLHVPHRFARTTTGATVCTAPARTMPPAWSFTSASISWRRTVDLDPPASGPILLAATRNSFSSISVKRTFKTCFSYTGIDSSSQRRSCNEMPCALVRSKVSFLKVSSRDINAH